LSQHLSFLLLGLANGAVFAALGLTLVVTHRSTKVLNFAVSGLSLLAATLYSGLRRGDLLLLIPGLPRAVHTGELGFPLAALLTLVIVGALGPVLYYLVFRPLRTAPVVASAVASIGVSVVIAGIVSKQVGTSPKSVGSIFPTDRFTFGDVSVTQDRVFVAVTVVVVALAVWAMWRFTRFGLISRAVSQSEKGAYLSGVPADRIATLNWVLSAVIAGVAGILIAPIVPPVPIEYTLFIVPALAVATLGGFARLAPTVIGGLVLGAIQSEVAYLQVQHSWIPRSGAAEMVPLVLILVVLVARAKPLPQRGLPSEGRLGRAPRVHSLPATALGGTAIAAVALIVLQHDKRAAVVTTLIFAMIALSQVVVTGYSGQISLSQLTFAGTAGFLLGSFTTDWHIPFPIAPLLAATAAMVIGVVFALPAVRVRGLPVAVVTLALAVALEAVWFRNTDLVTSSGRDVTGPSLFGVDLSIGSGAAYPRLAFCFLVLGVLVVVAVGVARLRTSSLGAAMLAVRANERAAAAAGVNVVRTKIAAFAIGAFIAGLGGALLGYKQGNVTVSSFTVYLGLSLFATAYLTGITSVAGAMLAGLFALDGVLTTFTQEHIDIGTWYPVIAGLGMVYSVVKEPEGIVGRFHAVLNERWLRSRPVVAVREEVTDPSAVIRAPRSAPGDPLLSVRSLTVRYGGLRAVDEVTFDVRRGAITGLIGPNGAGKTTLLDAISGFAPSEGEVALGSEQLGRLRPDQRARRGLGRTFQSIELYEDLTVLENISVGLAAGEAGASSLDEIMDVLGLAAVAERPARELSQGTRQLVSIARALAGRPSVLLLDEPAAGLDSTESRWLGARLRGLRDRGIAILLVDHDLQLVLDLCDDIVVLDFGGVIAAGSPEEVRNSPEVRRAYIGGEATSLDVSDVSLAVDVPDAVGS
jgi:ABC-type branched-subunit amino acid transport system ATPase component/ABC-type branched-subunit amino acid transport system permease subunit